MLQPETQLQFLEPPGLFYDGAIGVQEWGLLVAFGAGLSADGGACFQPREALVCR